MLFNRIDLLQSKHKCHHTTTGSILQTQSAKDTEGGYKQAALKGFPLFQVQPSSGFLRVLIPLRNYVGLLIQRGVGVWTQFTAHMGREMQQLCAAMRMPFRFTDEKYCRPAH